MAGMCFTLLCVLVTFVVLPTARASGARQARYQRNAAMEGLQPNVTALFQVSAHSPTHCGLQCTGLGGCRSYTYIADQPSSCRGYTVTMTSQNASDAEPAAGATTFEVVLADVDECSSNPCQNSGTCTDQLNGYLCQCAPGYEGLQCQTDVDECSSNPCQNSGTCTDQLNGYLCQCAPGYEGLQCQTDVDECSSNPCQNSGTCTDQLNGYLCQCAPGYEGLQCQTDLDECLSNPCQNSGTCTDQINGYLCQCAPGYEGLQCQTVSAWLESPCCATSECPVAASECLKGKCLCTPGYYYSTGSRTCLTD